jgi:CRP-like cAMP-binding protein
MRFQARGCSQRIDSFGVGHLTGIQFVDPEPAERRRLWEVVQRQSAQLSRFLDESPDLEDLDLDETMDLARATRLREVPRGRRLYGEETWRPGEDSVFVVIRGTVAIDARRHRARDVWLERVEPGGLFGGLPLIAKIPHVESATAEADLQLLEIDRFTFRYLEWTRPQIARAIARGVMRKQARHLSDLIRRVADAA